jgi:hypothetical protein
MEICRWDSWDEEGTVVDEEQDNTNDQEGNNADGESREPLSS